jgi:hypothetical protein
MGDGRIGHWLGGSKGYYRCYLIGPERSKPRYRMNWRCFLLSPYITDRYDRLKGRVEALGRLFTLFSFGAFFHILQPLVFLLFKQVQEPDT